MCVKGAVGLGAEPSIYFGKEKSVGHTERSLCPSLSALALPCVSLPKAGLICLSLGPSALASLKISQAQQMALCWLQAPPVL